jgi:hypothetical protein
MELVGSSVNSTTNNFVKNLEKIFVLANLNSAGLFSGGIKYLRKSKFYKKIFQKSLKGKAHSGKGRYWRRVFYA